MNFYMKMHFKIEGYIKNIEKSLKNKVKTSGSV